MSAGFFLFREKIIIFSAGVFGFYGIAGDFGGDEYELNIPIWNVIFFEKREFCHIT